MLVCWHCECLANSSSQNVLKHHVKLKRCKVSQQGLGSCLSAEFGQGLVLEKYPQQGKDERWFLFSDSDDIEAARWIMKHPKLLLLLIYQGT